MSTIVTFHDPFARPWHQLGLELVFLAACALTLRHALRDRRSTFQWLTAFAYGLWMELIALTFLDNYTHAKFSVQLYRDKLPLYVLALYPVYHYTGLKLAERFRTGIIGEALLAGFATCLIDVPFDLTGVGAGWWSWASAAKDPTLAARWLDVPVTSYYWYLLFGASYALTCRGALRLARDRRALQLAFVPIAGALMIVFGAVFFLPFHALHRLGVPDDAPVIAQLFLCAGVAVLFAPRELHAAGRGLLAVPLLLAGYQLVVQLALRTPPFGERLGVLAFAALGTLFLMFPKEVPWTIASRSRPIRTVGSPSDSPTSSPPTRS